MIMEDVDEEVDVVTDVDEEDEEMYKGEVMEGAVDAAMVPLKDVPPISSLHHHRSSCFFQSCLLIQSEREVSCDLQTLVSSSYLSPS